VTSQTNPSRSSRRPRRPRCRFAIRAEESIPVHRAADARHPETTCPVERNSDGISLPLFLLCESCTSAAAARPRVPRRFELDNHPPDRNFLRKALAGVEMHPPTDSIWSSIPRRRVKAAMVTASTHRFWSSLSCVVRLYPCALALLPGKSLAALACSMRSAHAATSRSDLL